MDNSKEKQSNTQSNTITNFSNEIAKIQALKLEGNELYKKDIESALKKYDIANNCINEVMNKANNERQNNPQVKELDVLKKQILSNLSSCYLKLNDYQKSIDLDKSIIYFDPNYDKCYARLFKSNVAINNHDAAVRYGRILKSVFSYETLEKYKEIIPVLESQELILSKLNEELRAKEKKTARKSRFIKKIPMIIFIIAVLIYYFFFKNKGDAVIESPMSSSSTNNSETA